MCARHVFSLQKGRDKSQVENLCGTLNKDTIHENKNKKTEDE